MKSSMKFLSCNAFAVLLVYHGMGILGAIKNILSLQLAFPT